jgi:hypothetical protein
MVTPKNKAARNWSKLRRPSMSVETYGNEAFWTVTRTVTRFASLLMRGSPFAGYGQGVACGQRKSMEQ